MAGLDIRDLSAGYGPTRIIEGLSLNVPSGTRLAVLGRNGVGKTTLLAAIAGHCDRHGGRIELDGNDLSTMPPHGRALAGLGYVPQNRAIFRSLSVEENLMAGLKSRPRSDIDEAYALFPRLRERRRNPGGSLSGGEQQMLSIARTLLGRPRVLLLDEPLEGLAPVICDEVMAALATPVHSMTVLLVEQRLAAALDFAHHAVVLERGRIVWTGPSAELRHDRALITRHLGVTRSD